MKKKPLENIYPILNQNDDKKSKIKKRKICLIVLAIILIILLISISILSFYYFYFETINCFCRLGSTRRIVGGKIASVNFVPYQVSIANADKHYCSGVIVNSHFILTAAHCVVGMNILRLRIRVGINNLNDTDLADKTYSVIRSFVHPSFSESKDIFSVNDIALLRTFYPIKFGPKVIDAACLNLDDEIKAYSTLMISGWGTTTRSILENNKTKKGRLSNSLKYADYLEAFELDCKDYLICAKPRNSKDSACHGDSGGPISFTRKGNTTVEGVASFTFPLESKKYPDRTYLCAGPTAFSRIASNKLFIKEIIGTNYCGNFN